MSGTPRFAIYQTACRPPPLLRQCTMSAEHAGGDCHARDREHDRV
jgi:hypothetical protein